MAGILTHLYIGNEILNKRKIKSNQIRNYFLLGNFMPDSAYWPGENSLFSDLSHYLLAARIPELIYNETQNENWRSFALGWLLHLQTDLVFHPLINEFAAQYYHGKNHTSQKLTYEMDPQIHALIENGLDRQLLSRYFPQNNIYSPPLIEQDYNFADILNKMYPVNFANEVLLDLVKKSSYRLKFYYRFILNLEKNKVLSFSLKVLLKLFRIFISRSKYQLLSSIVEPLKLEFRSIEKYKNAVQEFVKSESLKENPEWFKSNYNFDTGSVSKLGEYDLADKIFNDLDKSDYHKSLIWNDFKELFLSI